MKVMKYLNTLVMMVILSFISCTKENEPSWILGVWDVEQYFINGHDSTSALKNQTCYTPLKFVESYYNNPDFFSYEPANWCGAVGSYSYNKNTKELKLGFYRCDWVVIGLLGSIDFLQIYKAYYIPNSYFKMSLEMTKNNIHEYIILKKIR